MIRIGVKEDKLQARKRQIKEAAVAGTKPVKYGTHDERAAVFGDACAISQKAGFRDTASRLIVTARALMRPTIICHCWNKG